MPKPSKFPELFDDALQLDICKLKEWGYLNPNQYNRSTLNWSRNGNPTGSISITIFTHISMPYIELDYKYREEPRKYRINLITKPSNLGKGVMWFFICPSTGKHCRKLHSVGGYFLHRTAFKGCMYKSQVESKKYRDIGKLYGAYFKSDQLYEQLYKKHLKSSYAGKPTKKYAKLMAEIKKCQGVSIDDIESLLVN